MLNFVVKFCNEFWVMTCQMAPWLLFGFLIAGLLSVFFSASYVRKHLGDKGLKSIIKAALIGVPLPLCSCGVIPVTAALRKQGAGRGAAGAFLISTPQTGVDSFLVTYSMLGWVFAIFKPVFAFVTGIIGGLLIEKFGEQDAVKPEQPEEHCCEGTDAAAECACDDDECLPEKPRKTLGQVLYQTLHYGFVVLLGDIALSLLIGLLAATVISMAVPDNYAADTIGKSWLAMPLMMLIGIPLYVCSTASVPIAAALILKGFSPGAALVFLITGPATNAAAVSAMWQVLGRRSTMIYLAVLAVCSLLAGLLLDFLISGIGAAAMPSCHMDSNPGIFGKVSAVTMLALIAAALIRQQIKHLKFKARSAAAAPEELVIRISGLTCSHCQAAAHKAVMSVSGVQSADIDLVTGRAVIKQKTAADIFPSISGALKSIGFSCDKE